VLSWLIGIVIGFAFLVGAPVALSRIGYYIKLGSLH